MLAGKPSVPKDILAHMMPEERNREIFPFISRSYDYRILTALATGLFLILFFLDYFVFTGLELAYAVTFTFAIGFFFIAFFTAKKVGCYATSKRLLRHEKNWFGEDYQSIIYQDIISIEYTSRPSLPFFIISWFYFLIGWLMLSALREQIVAYLLFAPAVFFLFFAFIYRERMFRFYAPGTSAEKWTMRFEKLRTQWCLDFVKFIESRLPGTAKASH